MTYNYYVCVSYAGINDFFVEVSETEYEKFQDELMKKKRDYISWKTIYVPEDPHTCACQLFLNNHLVGFVLIPSYDID